MINTNKPENEVSAKNGRAVGVRDALTFLLVGGGVGAALALLFAPKPGREIRHDIADASRRGYDLTVERASSLKAQSAEHLETLKDKAAAAYESAATKLNAGSDAILSAPASISDGLDEIHRDASVRFRHASVGRRPASIF